MSVRTDYSEVSAILGATADDLTSDQVDAAITDASAWVDENLVGVGLAAGLLVIIEKNLAAHLCVLIAEGGDGMLIASTRADISERYAQRNTEHGATSYIKTAAAFDRTGKVKEYWLGGKRVQFRVGDGYNFDGATG